MMRWLLLILFALLSAGCSYEWRGKDLYACETQYTLSGQPITGCTYVASIP